MSAIIKKRVFHSKIILFGEYTILMESNGLIIPYSHFNGSLGFINKNSYTDLEYAKDSNQKLSEYCTYLKEKLKENIHIKKLKSDIEKGLFFESSIPKGYGLGSSGALVASIYTKYGINKIPSKAGLAKQEIKELKNIFSIMESYFHGKSSGLDPLTCYLGHPLFIENQEDIRSIGISRKNIQKDDAVFIVNTNKTGMTAPLVELFMKKCLNKIYHDRLINELIPLTNNCIQHLLHGNMLDFYKDLKAISRFQLDYLKEMIPDEFVQYWKEGIDNNDYILKLCGSGGGGYLLGFTRKFNEVKKLLTKKGLEVIPVYQEV